MKFMKKLFLLAMVMFSYNVMNAAIDKIQDAGCDCSGKIQATLSHSQCDDKLSRTGKYRLLRKVNGGQWENIHEDQAPVSNMNDVYVDDDLCAGTYEYSWELELTWGIGGNPLWAIIETKTVVITGVSEPLVVDVQTPQVNCDGDGIADITISGGDGVNSIIWEKDGNPFPHGNGKAYLSDLEEGHYKVTITYGGGSCTREVEFDITSAIGEISFDLDVQHAGCDGGSEGSAAVLNVSPANGIVSIASTDNNIPLGNPALNLPPGDYYATVFVLPNCTKTVNFTILDVPELIIEPEIRHSGCYGTGSDGRIELNVTSGTPPYKYNWEHEPANDSPISEGLSSGIYRVTVTDANGCEKELEIEITDVPSMSISIVLKDVKIEGDCKSLAKVEIVGGTPPFSIKWGNGSITDTEIIDVFPAQHTVTVTDANGCEITEQVVNASCNLKGWIWAPNPISASNLASISIDFASTTHLKLNYFDLSFNLVHQSDKGVWPAGNQIISEQVPAVPPGNYYVIPETNGMIEFEQMQIIIY